MFLTQGDATPQPDELNFNFVGRISTCPTTKSLPLCRAFGHTFYIEALLSIIWMSDAMMLRQEVANSNSYLQCRLFHNFML